MALDGFSPQWCRLISKIVTVEVDPAGQDRPGPVLKRAPAGVDSCVKKRKTALAPPAVRAPVFPHSLPVTEGLKPAIRLAGYEESTRSRICFEIAKPPARLCHDGVCIL